MSLPFAHGGPVAEACLKARPEDFQVYECMHVNPEGEGEHLWLEIEKTGWNTEDVAMWLAKSAGVHRLSVGYSGLKDKHAVTRQWFSLHLPGKADPDLEWPQRLKLIQASRHRRKLNRGTHRANRFVIRATDFQGDAEALAGRLAAIDAEGIPNYFGEQRFGRGAGNLVRGRDWLTGGEAPRKKSLRSIWLSAVRSDLFNQVLAERVHRGVWNRLLEGDILQPQGSRGLFNADEDAEAAARVASGEVHPTAPMPGVAGMASSGPCRDMEQQILAPSQAVIDGLCREGVDEIRRATRLPVQDLQWSLLQEREGEHCLELAFTLPAGAFATTVMAELVSTPRDSA
ncbi:MAG: tRNA pseudouridine(13) synthase TruD [Pseudomonadota bacterium]|nr:tRNA pseudouridine(13) synthase TruD [Pseudomonadota bacterium]